MYEGFKFCVNCVEDEMRYFIGQRKGMRQSCSLSPHLFNISVDYIIDYISKDNPPSPVDGTTTDPGLLSAYS
jgi:hypothetical protein